MEDPVLGIVYFFLSVISIIALISFFYLCSNVSKIKKSIITDFHEYRIQKEIGNKEKAFYHLQRDFILNVGKDQMYASDYYTLFKKLGAGIPDFEEFEELIKEDEEKK